MDPLLEQALRKDPMFSEIGERVRRRKQVEGFLEGQQGERKAKLGQTLGLEDLLTFLPAGMAAKSLKTGNLGAGALNALAFTSQFDNSKLGGTTQDILAAAPFFALSGITGSTKGLAAAQKRLAERGKELPLFSGEGKMSPARQKQFEKRIRTWAERGSDSKTVSADLEKWIDSFKGDWGRRPVDKRVILDRMPASVRPGLYEAAKDMGYGGIKMPPTVDRAYG